jgi:hypothetical protein
MGARAQGSLYVSHVNALLHLVVCVPGIPPAVGGVQQRPGSGGGRAAAWGCHAVLSADPALSGTWGVLERHCQPAGESPVYARQSFQQNTPPA